MKAVCVSCFNYYDHRLKYVEEVLVELGYSVHYITSDFDHISKSRFTIDKKNATQIKTLEYSKNISIKRIASHYFFSKKMYEEFKEIKPDLIFVMIPPNFIASFAAKYKKENPRVRLVIDVHDLWPETFPSSKAKKLLSIPFKYWSNLRDSSLIKADMVFSECNLFREKISHLVPEHKNHVFYLAKEKSQIKSEVKLEADQIDICYLGSINSIIDIDLILELLSEINKLKKVVFHIIGDGENRDTLIERSRELGISVICHGKIFDQEEKRKIFDRCYFGINIMKSEVLVGLTMKSADYFQAGLPILNNIQGDTKKWVDELSIGFNVTSESVSEVANLVSNLSLEEAIEMRSKTNEFFSNYIDSNTVKRALKDKLTNFKLGSDEVVMQVNTSD